MENDNVEEEQKRVVKSEFCFIGDFPTLLTEVNSGIQIYRKQMQERAA